MSRQLERRLIALERAVSPGRVQYAVSDRLPEVGDDVDRCHPVTTEAEWIKAYGEVDRAVACAAEIHSLSD